MLNRIMPITLAILFLATAALSASPEPPGKKDRCPVCGMFVAPYPEWIATIVQKDGSQLYFDGCKDLFRYYFELSSEQRETIDSIYVTEYYTTRLTAADQVYFVLGSDVLGPMGHELIPIVGEENARTFLRDHRGREILRFDQLDASKLPEQ